MAGGDLTAYIDYDTTKAKRSLDDLDAKNHRTTSTIERAWSKAGENSAKMFGPGNLLRAAFAGIGAAVGIATAGLREYAKVSDEAAGAMRRMESSRSLLLRHIGADVLEGANRAGWNDPWQMASELYDSAGVEARYLFDLNTANNDGRSVAELKANMRQYRRAEDAALDRPAYQLREFQARTESDAVRSGDQYAKRIGDELVEMRRIALERQELSADDLLYHEKRKALMAEEIASSDRLNQIEIDRRENAEQRAEAAAKAAAAVAKEQLAAMMAGERSKDAFAFQERDLRLDMMRAAGADGVDAAEINLQFDRLKYGIASDTSISPEERDSRRARLDELRAERLALLGMESPEEAVRMRSFARPGSIGGGFAGVTSIYRQAFAPPGAGGPDVEVQQLKELQQIRKSVQGGQVARLG